MNEHGFEALSAEIVALTMAAGGWIMWAIRRMIGMNERLGVVECALLRMDKEREEARRRVEGLVIDVASIKADMRNSSENTNRILDILEKR